MITSLIAVTGITLVLASATGLVGSYFNWSLFLRIYAEIRNSPLYLGQNPNMVVIAKSDADKKRAELLELQESNRLVSLYMFFTGIGYVFAFVALIVLSIRFVLDEAYTLATAASSAAVLLSLTCSSILKLQGSLREKIASVLGLMIAFYAAKLECKWIDVISYPHEFWAERRKSIRSQALWLWPQALVLVVVLLGSIAVLLSAN